jgi:FkbM family methyltransferase
MNLVNILQKSLDLIPFYLREKIKTIPIVKQFQKKLIKKFLAGREFVTTIKGGPANGLRFPVKMPQDKGMWIGTWELEFAEDLAARVHKGKICYDIGGYKGYYAGIMALKGASKVLVFEPMPGNIEKINQLITLNPNLPIELIPSAVSDVTGKSIFRVMPEETMGKLNNSSFQENENHLGQIEVNCITLDSMINSDLMPDFIKIDVEGAEEFVLKGGIELLKLKKPVLMIEIHSREIGNRCLQLLQTIYSDIIVLETGKNPKEETPPEICHYVVNP